MTTKPTVQPGMERELSLHEAEARATAYLQERDWTARYTDLGDHAGEASTATRCQLVDAAGHAVAGAAGAGKGYRPHAKIGALYEAIEHHTTRTQQLTPEEIVLDRADRLAQRFDRDALGAVLDSEPPHAQLACADYELLDPSSRSYPMPLILSAPSWADPTYAADRETVGDTANYRSLARYASNSGSAIGGTRTEALLHALNEVIERDAFSLLLHQAFLSPDRNHYRPRTIDPTTLPPDLHQLHADVEHHLKAPVWLLDISTTDIAVPAVLAYTPPTVSVGHHQRGIGASLSAHHATYRALAELKQGSLIGEFIDPPFEHLLPYPQFHNAATCDLTTSLDNADLVAFTDSPVTDSPTAQLATVQKQLERAGFTPLARQVLTHDSGLTVIHAVVPGLERIMTLVQGILVLPGPRATRSYATTPS